MKLRARQKIWLSFMAIILLAGLAGVVDYPKGPDITWDGKLVKELKVHLGLDLQGGTSLVYQADLSQISAGEEVEAMEGVRDVIERRINAFGVSEPVVQTSKTGESYRVNVELAGVTDIDEAIKQIGETPLLEFKEEGEYSEEELTMFEEFFVAQEQEIPEGMEIKDLVGPKYNNTELGGKQLESAEVIFDQQTNYPQVSLQFDSEGKELFGEITERNVGKTVAIYLDDQPISTPMVQEAITQGQAIISGDFDLDEAKTLARRLNAGALPVPIELVNQRNVGPTLGQESIERSLMAAVIGLVVLALFMIFYYRLPGIMAVMALFVYGLLVLAIFKLWPVTLTLAGIAGFILSIGMAVDANVLIFERTKEELRAGKPRDKAVNDGFDRAWLAIRDSNISTLITCLILAWFGTSLIQGFAITLAIGVSLSMFSAIVITRTFLKLVYKYVPNN